MSDPSAVSPTAARTAVGLLHPGSMGATLGELLQAAGCHVQWASEGRSKRTLARAEERGFEDLGDLTSVARASDVIVSICPPEASMDVAEQVMATGFAGRYLDANATSPEHAKALGELVTSGGATFTDGSVIGPPPRVAGTSRLYLSGPDADFLADFFRGSACDARALEGPPGTASALKMSYAAFTKGRGALEAACLALADHYGLLEELKAEWELMYEGRMAEVEGNLLRQAPKAWRFGGEMTFIAQSFAAAGLPDGFHLAARDIWLRWSHYRGREGEDLSVDRMVAELTGEQ